MLDIDDEVWYTLENYDFKWGKQFFGNLWLCFVDLRKTTFLSANWIMGWKIVPVEKEHSKQLANVTLNLEFSDRHRRLTTNSKNQVVKLAPMFYESVFREKNRAGNFDTSQLRDQKLNFERD